ncbi:aldo/keto reductase [Myxococcus sp. CA040A]|uniref:aldo/keto reductase n=1 Tax=Myxococcus sp. CA040A TaxID=2741738 RepID=UPI00157A407F|nr:aldo/keto reductase [Myxococcus sp. CA040A]NTX04186.1 aldo/keto reductase [Myxococcus sp. CA040A]
MSTHEARQTRHTEKPGTTGPEVFPLGLGCMGMSGMYGATNDDESLRTVHAAIERGVTLLDTGDFYGMGHNELLVGRAIAGRRERVQLSVKFGALRGPDGSWLGMDLRPAAVKNFATYSLKRLGVDVIDIYRPARLDPNVPIEETIGAMSDLVKAGYVRHIGLSEVGAETLRRAHRVHPIADLQIEYSLASRGPESNIFPTLRELGISATLYGVLSRGLLTGSKPTGAGDFRAHLPRFSGEHREKNKDVVGSLHRFAQERRMSPAQLAIAWVLARQPGFVPVIGMKNVAQLDDALGALNRPLTSEDVAALDSLGAVSGGRYGPEQMRLLDSERR